MKFFGFEVREAPFASPVLKLERRAAPASAIPVSTYQGGYPWQVREPYTGAWQKNDEWTVEGVLTHHAVYACVTRIAQDIGKLRPRLVEQDEDGIWSETWSPAFSGVLTQPNRYQNHLQFKESWITSKLLHGNTYALKRRDGRGVVDALYLLDPTRVTVLVSDDGSVFYELCTDNLSADAIARFGPNPVAPASEMVHDRFNCLFHPLVGTSPIHAAGTIANMGLHIARNSADFFANGSNPSGILSSPNTITPQKSKELSAIWNEQFSRDKSGRVAVVGDAMRYEPLRMTAVDSQLIEQLNWSAEKVCSVFHVPAHKVGIGPQPTYSNGEQRNQDYYSDCLQSHIESFELCMDEALGLRTPTNDGRVYGVELDLDGLLRMDSASQMETLTKGVRGGVLTPNEARKSADKPPLKGGDTIYLQHQDYPMEKIFERTDLDPEAEITPPDPPMTEAVIADVPPDASRALALLVEVETFALELAG